MEFEQRRSLRFENATVYSSLTQRSQGEIKQESLLTDDFIVRVGYRISLGSCPRVIRVGRPSWSQPRLWMNAMNEATVGIGISKCNARPMFNILVSRNPFFLHTFHNFILVSYILIIGLSLHRSCLFLCRIYFFGIFSRHLHKVMHKLRFASNYEWSWIQLKYPVISLRTNLIDISLYLEFPKSFFFCSLYGPVVAQV